MSGEDDTHLDECMAMGALRQAQHGAMNANASHEPLPWHIGDRLHLDSGSMEVQVENIRGDLVCCGWWKDGIYKRSWIPASRLRARGRNQDERVIVIR